MVPYVDGVVAVTVMRVLLFVLHVCILRECEGARLTDMLVWGMGLVSAGHVGDTQLRVMDECDALDEKSWWCMCLCLTRGGVGGEGVSG